MKNDDGVGGSPTGPPVGAPAPPGSGLLEPDFGEIIGRALKRASVATGDVVILWRHLQSIAQLTSRGRGHSARVAVLGNAIGLMAHGDADDFADAARIVEHVGLERAAQLYDDLVSAVDTSSHLLRLGLVVRRLGLGDAGSRELAVNIVVARLDSNHLDTLPPDSLRGTVADLRVLHDAPALDVLRAKLAVVAANPWGPYAAHLEQAAAEAELPHIAELVVTASEVLRRRHEAEEKLAVGRMLRQLVAESGLSQREFASHVGTSPSRLSTYLNGQVMPSAALALRIRRVGRKLSAERARKFAGG